MKLGSELNLTREQKSIKKIGDDIMPENYDVIVNLKQLGKRIADV